MSVSGNLRMELGGCLDFCPSMLPKNILNDDVKKSLEPRFVLKSSKAQSSPQDIQKEQDSCVCADKEEVKTPDKKENNKIEGMTPEELMKMFNVAQEASVRELTQLYNTDNLSENDCMQNPFYNKK